MEMQLVLTKFPTIHFMYIHQCGVLRFGHLYTGFRYFCCQRWATVLPRAVRISVDVFLADAYFHFAGDAAAAVV